MLAVGDYIGLKRPPKALPAVPFCLSAQNLANKTKILAQILAHFVPFAYIAAEQLPTAMNIKYQTRGATPSSVRVVITHRGKVWRKAVGLSVQNWNQKTQRSGNIKNDQALKTIRIGLESALNELSSDQDIENALKRVYEGKWHDIPANPSKPSKTPSFASFFKEWSERECGALRQNKTAYNVVSEIVGKGTRWEDFDDAFLVRLLDGFRKRGMRPNYQGVVLGRLKTALNEAYALHYIKDDSFRNWKKPTEETFAVALTEQEVEMLWDADLDKKQSRVRDLFLLGIYTAARFSDYSQLTEDNIVDGRLSFVQQKTGIPVLIPCHPRVLTILERNGGSAPRMCIQSFNQKIKDVCREAGIGSVIQVPPGTLAHLGKERGDVVHKWELCSSHTARRTGASLLYKSGVPVRVCRYLTGHTKDDTFLKYIKIDREEAADILADSPFFK